MSRIILRCKCGGYIESDIVKGGPSDTPESRYYVKSLAEIWLEDHRNCNKPAGMVVLNPGEKFEPIAYSKAYQIPGLQFTDIWKVEYINYCTSGTEVKLKNYNKF
jgi:hypothetical protein